MLNLLLKASMNGVSTISGGNEFQLFTTLILKANIFFTRAGTSKLFELLQLCPLMRERRGGSVVAG